MKQHSHVRSSDLPALLPDDAFPLAALVHPDMRAVQRRLAEGIAGDQFPADVTAAYAEALLCLWSLDGRPIAAAVLPQSRRGSGQPPPLSAYLLRLIILDAAYRLDLTDLLPPAIQLVDRLATVLGEPALHTAFPILMQSPEAGRNDLFRFHWEAHSLPIYPRLAARVHRFLVRKLRTGEGITRWLTPILRISEAFASDRLPPPMVRLDHNEPGIRALYKQVREVVADLPNIFAPARRLAAGTTQPKYAHQFMAALDIAGLTFSGADLIFTPGPRLPLPEVDRLDTDPPEEPDEPFATYEDRLRQEAEEEGLLEDEPLPDSPAELVTVPELEGLHPADALRRRAYVRQRATMAHDFAPDDWASLPLFDLALGYAALLPEKGRLSGLELPRLAGLLLYHLMVVTGRPCAWLLQAHVGRMPESPEGCPWPVLDPDRFAFFSVPAAYPALGAHLRRPEPDEDGDVDPAAVEGWKRCWEAHTRTYTEVTLLRALPLDPSARLLTAVYLDARHRALARGPLHADLCASAEHGPLFVTHDRRGAVRPFTEEDFSEVLARINASRRAGRPDAPPVTRPRLRRAAVSHLLACGLDRVAAHLVTGRHLPGLRAPLFYTLVSSDELTRAYHRAAARLCAELGHAYRQARLAGALPWEDAEPPQPSQTVPACCYGALYHPRPEHIHAVVQAFLANARQPPSAGVTDPQALERGRHDALIVLACYLLTLFAGLRVGEVATMQRVQIDFPGAAWGADVRGLITVSAKADRFYEEYRVLPTPPPLAPLLAEVLSRCARASGFDDPYQPAFWLYRSLPSPVPARRQHLWDYLDGIARAARLSEGAPRWHSARHYLRTFLYRQGVDEAVINYVLGHQTEGREAGNPFCPSDLPAVFAAYQRATLALAEELELDFDGLW